jgi:hypothetical protein
VLRAEAERIVCPVAARPVVLCPARPEAARPDVPAGLHREHLKAPARPSAAAARKVRALQATEEAVAMVAQRLVQAERLAPPALQAAEVAAVQEAQQVPRVSAAQPRAAPEVWDVAVVPRPAAEPAEAVRRLEVAAVLDVAAAVQRRAAGLASAAVRLRVAGPASAAGRLRGAEVLDAGVLRRVARGAQGVLLLAAAWAALPSTRLGGRLAPSARARSAHARRQLPTARP